MGEGFATVTEEDGVVLALAEVNGFTLSEIRFPPGYVQGPFEPELPYIVLVIEGGLEKTFPLRSIDLRPAFGLVIPVGATHSARFGSEGARVVVVRPKDASTSVAGCFERLVDVRGPALGWLAWRLAAELRTSDSAAPLAAEGFALELLAAASRESGASRRPARVPAWLSSAEELLRARVADCISLSEVAAEIGVHPAHLARAFRARYGVSVGEYGRRVRLSWAAAELARSEQPLAVIAGQAGFADQSHFTRLFRRYIGTTPARYREETRRARSGNLAAGIPRDVAGIQDARPATPHR